MRARIAILTALALAASPAVGAQQESVAASSEKLICKKQLETGSLVKKRKQCMTRADWERVAQSQQDGSRRMVDELTTRPAG